MNVKTLRTFAREWLIPLAIALVVALLLRTYVFATARIDGDSMLGTFEDGQRAAVTKIDLHFAPLTRGEIVICHYPGDARHIVKRVIALGGDTVEIRSGVLYLNGAAVDEPYVTRPDRADFPLTEVPEGCYFVLGDNRPVSYDSRAVGPLPANLIEGRVRFIYWPPNRLGFIEP